MSDEPKKENKPSTPAKKGTADKNKNVAKQPPEKTNDTKSAKSGSGIGWLALLLVLGPVSYTHLTLPTICSV